MDGGLFVTGLVESKLRTEKYSAHYANTIRGNGEKCIYEVRMERSYIISSTARLEKSGVLR